MKSFKNSAAQGDILIRRIDELPADIEEQKPVNGKHIIAHSETGHHHSVLSQWVKFFKSSVNPMMMFMQVSGPSVLNHERNFDTHEPIEIGKGLYEIRRQREYTPEGWRRIED